MTERKSLRVRITGDAAQPQTIDVYDADTGAKLTNVISVDMHLERAPGDSQATVTLFEGVEVDLTAKADMLTMSPRDMRAQALLDRAHNLFGEVTIPKSRELYESIKRWREEYAHFVGGAVPKP